MVEILYKAMLVGAVVAPIILFLLLVDVDEDDSW